MSDLAATPVWRHAVGGTFGVALDDTAAAAAAGLVARGVQLAAPTAPGALFDVEPSHHARALEQGAPR